MWRKGGGGGNDSVLESRGECGNNCAKVVIERRGGGGYGNDSVLESSGGCGNNCAKVVRGIRLSNC